MTTFNSKSVQTIEADYDRYIGIMYDGQSGDGIPVGMIGPSDQLSDIAKAAGQWLAEGAEWLMKRKVVIAYRPDDTDKPMEVDAVMTSDVKGEVHRYELVKIEDPS